MIGEIYTHPDIAYGQILEHILEHGIGKTNRTGVDTISSFGLTYTLDVSEHVPFLTTKFVNPHAVIAENCWFLSGDPTIKRLQDWGLSFWNPWANDKGQLETAYGNMWRHFPLFETGGMWRFNEDTRKFDLNVAEHAGYIPTMSIANEYVTYDETLRPGIDQVAWILDQLRNNPDNRRLVLTAWHPGNSIVSRLPACHFTSVWNVQGDRLNVHLTQRSADVPVGVPFNMAGYGFLLHLFAAATGLKPGLFSHTLVDAHIYVNQIEGVKEQLSRMGRIFTPPTLTISANLREDPYIRELHPKDFSLDGYLHHPAIKFPVAV